MKLHELPKLTGLTKEAKRIGRGHGSGKGKTAGRGTKGQKARGKIPANFSVGGGRRSKFLKHMPYLRGIGNSKISPKPILITLEQLKRHPAGVVNVDSILAAELVSPRDLKNRGVKIVGIGTLETNYDVTVPTTRSAAEKIELAGGTVRLKR